MTSKNKAKTSHYLSQNDLLNVPEVLMHSKIGKLAGMCDALCYDWVRRVLQDGKIEFGPEVQEGSNSGVDPKLKSAGIRAGFGQKNIIYTQNNDLFNIFVTAYNKILNTSATSMITLDVDVEKNLIMSRYLEKSSTGRYQCGVVREALMNANGNQKIKTQVVWQEKAKAWDKFWSETRGSNSPHPFSKISQVEYKNYTTYSSVYEGVKDAVLQLSQGNKAVIVGFHTDKKGTDGGHALAFHRTNAGQYRFFDPNFGVFEYKDYMLASVAMLFVIQHAYPEFKWEPFKTNLSFDMNLNVFVKKARRRSRTTPLPLFSNDMKGKITNFAAKAKLLAKSTGDGKVF